MSSDLCARCESPLSSSDLRCCICALAVPNNSDSRSPMQVAAKIFRCRECAAAITYNAAKQIPHCAFCGSDVAIEDPDAPIETPEWVMPFSVERDQASTALRGWLGSLGWFRPGDLSSAATVESLEPLHWAAWVFDADAEVSWAADSDAGSRSSSWAPHSGQTPFAWRNILVSASRGLRVSETARLAPGYDLETSLAFDEKKPPEFPGAVESFDMQRSAARKTIIDSIEAMAVQQLQVQDHIPGIRYRNVHAAVLLSQLRTKRYLLPAWVLAYRYKGALFRSVVHGQDPQIAFGEAPYSWAKIAGVVALIAGLLLTILGAFAI